MIEPLRDIADQPSETCIGRPHQPAPVAAGKALVGVKDSIAALHALAQTLEMGRRLRFPVAALAVAPAYNGDLTMRGLGSGEEGPARLVLDQALDIAVAEGYGLETYRATGLAHASILEMVQRTGFGLVVLGRGRGWTSPFNVAARVARQSPVDILVIPQDWSLRFNHLVCGVIGAPPEPVLDTALHLASLDGGRVTFFCLDEPPLPDAGVKVERVRTPRELYNGLREAAQEESTDMVVFAETPDGLRRRLGLPWSNGLLRASRCPVWIVKV